MSKKLIYLVSFVLVLGMGFSLAHGQEGLIGYWKFDESSGTIAADSTWRDNDGTLIGHQLRWTAGRFAGALSFPGESIDARVEFPTRGMSATAGTVAMWGYLFDPQPETQGRYFFGHTTQPQWANRVQIYMQEGTTPSRLLNIGLGNSHTCDTDIMELPMEEWLHVALTWDSGNYVVYVNGEEVSSGTYTGLSTLHPVANIGNDGSSGPYEAFCGLLDEVQLYDNALSSVEVLSAMQGQVWPYAWGLDPASVTDGHVYLFENVGGNVPDDSANTHAANLIGSPQVVDGLIGKALQFNGTSDGVHIPDATMVNLSTHQNRTVVAVFKCDDVYKTDKQVVYEEGGTTRGLTIYVHEGLVYAGGWNKADYDPQWNPGTFISAPISSNAWYTVAMVVRDGGAGQEDDKFEMWMNGELIGIGPGAELRRRSDDCAIGYQNSETTFHDGTVTGGGSYFEGIVDEIWMINDALTETEMGMVGKVWPYASGPNPANGAKYVNPNVELSWSSGFGAQLHIVYFGDNFDDVNHDAGGILLETKTYIPGPLELDQVYYWRVNEFDGFEIHKAEVWSFRTLPEIDPNLIGGWKFDEGSGTIAYDSSGNGNDGTLEDGPIVVEGKFGQALAFEASRVAIPASDSLTADLFQGSFTLSAWINPKRTGNTWQQIFRSMIAADTSNDTLFINNDGRLSWRGRIGRDWAGGMCETAPDVVPADQWTHVAVVGDGTNFRIYVNGALSQESAFQTTDGSNATYYLGGDPTWIGESYSGIIDDVRIYNVALSAEEIEALAQ